MGFILFVVNVVRTKSSPMTKYASEFMPIFLYPKENHKNKGGNERKTTMVYSERMKYWDNVGMWQAEMRASAVTF